jgi:hypothetical protein
VVANLLPNSLSDEFSTAEIEGFTVTLAPLDPNALSPSAVMFALAVNASASALATSGLGSAQTVKFGSAADKEEFVDSKPAAVEDAASGGLGRAKTKRISAVAATYGVLASVPLRTCGRFTFVQATRRVNTNPA